MYRHRPTRSLKSTDVQHSVNDIANRPLRGEGVGGPDKPGDEFANQALMVSNPT